jgi:hypothetical protein
VCANFGANIGFAKVAAARAPAARIAAGRAPGDLDRG